MANLSDLLSSYNPLNSYWIAQDGRIYSSKKNALVYYYDPGYVAFVATYGAAYPWPVDANGKQTTASMQQVMSQYLVTLPFS